MFGEMSNGVRYWFESSNQLVNGDSHVSASLSGSSSSTIRARAEGFAIGALNSRLLVSKSLLRNSLQFVSKSREIVRVFDVGSSGNLRPGDKGAAGNDDHDDEDENRRRHHQELISSSSISISSGGGGGQK
ncbi:hypothetical protein AND_007765 [Anopheles darlingi]|uniref:Uncharacterized protein n=1 Tax=Anopheles darlingi TaxID=43151 RepID=W5JCJ7_ANODA|nr:hypothetical protein AND_007765 [Anopheles darlingi]